MIYIRKQDTPPNAFMNAINGLTRYEDLQNPNRKAVTDLLLKEQGGLCAICERKASRFAPTIEHFLPKSIFENKQLDYYNLYVACQTCNSPKGNHLVPAYIFDKRFNPIDELMNQREGFKPIYELIDGNKCSIKVPNITKISKKIDEKYHSALILHGTLDLMKQNRHEQENQSLLIERGKIYNTYKDGLPILPIERLRSKYENWRQNIQSIQDATDIEAHYPEFVSLTAYLFAVEFRRRGIAP